MVASDVSAVGTQVEGPGVTQYGSGTAIKAFGHPASGYTAISHLYSDSGVESADVSGVGTARARLAGASWHS